MNKDVENFRKLTEAYENVSDFNIETLNSLTSFKKRLEYCRQTLPVIGRGSSRIVFQLPNGHVLKLAYNAKGVAQNEVEKGDYYSNSLSCFTEVFNVANDDMWIEAELGRKCLAGDFRRLMGFDFKTMCDIIVLIARARGRGDEQKYHHFFNKELAEKLIEESWESSEGLIHDLNEYVGNYDMSGYVADFMRLKQWGIVNRDGKETCVIVDRGVNRDVIEQYYRWGR